jgi:hypothetical protein
MTRFRITGSVLAAALAIGVGCGSANGRAQATTDSTAASPTRVVLGIDDHRRTIRVTRSTRLVLVLGGRYRWSDPVSGGAVDADAVISDAGSAWQTWELRPKRLGLARLTSAGSPACRPTTPGCPASGRRYSVTLDVRR